MCWRQSASNMHAQIKRTREDRRGFVGTWNSTRLHSHRMHMINLIYVYVAHVVHYNTQCQPCTPSNAQRGLACCEHAGGSRRHRHKGPSSASAMRITHFDSHSRGRERTDNTTQCARYNMQYANTRFSALFALNTNARTQKHTHTVEGDCGAYTYAQLYAREHAIRICIARYQRRERGVLDVRIRSYGLVFSRLTCGMHTLAQRFCVIWARACVCCWTRAILNELYTRLFGQIVQQLNSRPNTARVRDRHTQNAMNARGEGVPSGWFFYLLFAWMYWRKCELKREHVPRIVYSICGDMRLLSEDMSIISLHFMSVLCRVLCDAVVLSFGVRVSKVATREGIQLTCSSCPYHITYRKWCHHRHRNIPPPPIKPECVVRRGGAFTLNTHRKSDTNQAYCGCSSYIAYTSQKWAKPNIIRFIFSLNKILGFLCNLHPWEQAGAYKTGWLICPYGQENWSHIFGTYLE